MDALINQEKDIWLQLKTALDAVKGQMSRVRTDGVKGNVDKALSLFASLGRIRENLHEEMRDRITQTPSETKSCDANYRVADLEVKVLGALGHIQDRRTSQEKVLVRLSVPLHPLVTPGDTWTAVVKRPRRPRHPTRSIA